MWDTIFKAGRHTDSQGREREYTVADLHRIAASRGEIPLVVHHPENIAGAKSFGRASQLRVEGDKLQAQYENVPDELLAAVREGLHLNKSIALDPSTLQLMHVGLLGNGQEPAVEGLGPVCFSFKEAPFSFDYRMFDYV